MFGVNRVPRTENHDYLKNYKNLSETSDTNIIDRLFVRLSINIPEIADLIVFVTQYTKKLIQLQSVIALRIKHLPKKTVQGQKERTTVLKHLIKPPQTPIEFP